MCATASGMMRDCARLRSAWDRYGISASAGARKVVAAEARCGTGLVGLQTLSVAMGMLRAAVQRHHIAVRLGYVEQRAARQRIGVIPDVSAVGSFQHPDRGVVVDGDHSNRDAR